MIKYVILIIMLASVSFSAMADAVRPVMADDIPVAHTPPGGYGKTFPPPVLATCLNRS